MQATGEIQQGQVARSLAGRDKNRCLPILGVVDKTYVLPVDSKLGKLIEPKKKKIRHMQTLEQWVDPNQEGPNNNKTHKASKALNEPRRV